MRTKFPDALPIVSAWQRVQTFTDLQHLNEQALHRLNTVSNARLHSTTQERPVDRLPREHLKLPAVVPFGYVDYQVRKVPSDTLVSYEGNLQSSLWVTLYESNMTVVEATESIMRA